MARKKRRAYSLEFKLETVALVIERGLSPRQTAKDLGVDCSTISVWVKKAEAGEFAGTKGEVKTPGAPEAENMRLPGENATLRERRRTPRKGGDLLRVSSATAMAAWPSP